MEMRLNSTADYIYLIFYYYQLEWADLTNALFVWMNVVKTFFTEYQPCYNVFFSRDFHLYGCILGVKILILSHGVVSIVPLGVSLILFPALMAYYHIILETDQMATCSYTMWNFAFLWTLLWQFPYLNINGKYFVYIGGITIGVFFLEYVYVGFQFAIDVFVVLTTLWFVAKCFVNSTFNMTFIIAACAIFYFQQGRGPQIPEVFYIFLFLMFMGIYGAYASTHGGNDEMLFYFSTVIGITFLLCYNIMAYGFTGVEYSKAGKELPFKLLPVYEPPPLIEGKVHEDPTKDSPPYSDALLKQIAPVEEGFNHQAFIKDTYDAIHAPKPRIIRKTPRRTTRPNEPPVSEVVKPEIESLILTPDAYGLPNLSAGMLVKYRTNETVPTMLY